MEHLLSPAGATGGNRWQMGRARKPLKQADPQPVATHGNRFATHGKEGVDGSSPSEASQKDLHMGFFFRVGRAYRRRTLIPRSTDAGDRPFLALYQRQRPLFGLGSTARRNRWRRLSKTRRWVCAAGADRVAREPRARIGERRGIQRPVFT